MTHDDVHAQRPHGRPLTMTGKGVINTVDRIAAVQCGSSSRTIKMCVMEYMYAIR